VKTPRPASIVLLPERDTLTVELLHPLRLAFLSMLGGNSFTASERGNEEKNEEKRGRGE